MTTKTTAKKATGKQKDPRFRVHPGLSIKGTELRSRIKNRSILFDPNGQYSMDTEILETMKLSKPEILNKAMRNQEYIEDLQRKIEKANQEKNKSEMKKLQDELTELRKLKQSQ